MTDFFVSPSGSDASNGLGPDASAGTNKPYLTLGKAVNTGAAVVPGDRIICGPGMFYAAGCTPISGITSSASPTQILGDPTNAFGFKDGSGVRLAPAPAWLTTRTSGEGLNSPIASTASLITGTTNGPAGLQFKNLVMEIRYDSTTPALFLLAANNCPDLLVEDSVLLGCNLVTVTTGAPTAARNWKFRGIEAICSTFFNISVNIAAATADADLNILLEASRIYGRLSGNLALAASGGNLAGGLRFKGLDAINCSLAGGSNLIQTTALRVSTVTPITVEGIKTMTGVFVNAGTAGQVVDNGFNNIWAFTANTNLTDAATTIRNAAPHLLFQMLKKWGLVQDTSEHLAWTEWAHADQKHSAWGNTAPDFRSRTARPWGAGAAIGCSETATISHDTSSAISTGGTDSLLITGAGWELLGWVPVDAVATTISIVTKSTSYGGTNYPRILIRANPDIGLNADLTVTASSASEQTLTSSSFTPTAKGAVAVYGESRSSSVSSSTFFDQLTATP